MVGYGHLGDGNLHLNVSCKEYTPEVEAQIEPFVYEWTSQHRGSISAEHGLGRMKAECIGCAFLFQPPLPFPCLSLHPPVRLHRAPRTRALLHPTILAL